MPDLYFNPRAVTPEQLASWFPESKFGRPSAKQCRELAASINRVRISSTEKREEWEKQQSAHEHLKTAARACEKLKTELNALVSFLPSSAAHYGYIIDAADRFLRMKPDIKPGRPELFWVGLAHRWAQDIVGILTQSNKQRPSLNASGGPVTAVLAQILEHCFGEEFDTVDIGRRLRERELRLKRQGNSA